MNSLALFPSLLAYGSISPLVIRVVLGITLLFFGVKKIRGMGDSVGSNSRTYGVAEVMVAVCLIIGLFTQLAAILNAVILVLKLGFKYREKKFLSTGVNYYMLLLAMALSLIFSGSGLWSLDTIL